MVTIADCVAPTAACQRLCRLHHLWALPKLIRSFRKATALAELVPIESCTLELIAGLKGGRVDVGFGRARFEDPAVCRAVLCKGA